MPGVLRPAGSGAASARRWMRSPSRRAGASLCRGTGKTGAENCQAAESQGDHKLHAPCDCVALKSGAAQAAGVAQRLNSPLLVFAVSCSLPAGSRHRIRELAEPKKEACANDPRLVWGTQETIWTLSWRAVTAQPSPRTVALAKPKQDFGKNQCRSLFLYGCGRESTIWECPLLVDFRFPSDRLLKLSEPKKYQAAYLQQRCQQRLQMLRPWPEHPRGYSVSQSPGSGR